MKILIPTADYPPIEGGISTLTVHLSRELSAMGHDVTVVAPYFREPVADPNLGAARINVVRYRGYGFGWLRVVPMLAASWRHLRNADLILAINISYGGLIGYLARRSFGVPYLTFAYAYEFLKFRRNSFPAALYRRLYAGSRRVIAISRFTRDNLIGFGIEAARIRVIHPGARPVVTGEPEAAARVRDKYALGADRVILCAGRFVPRKNHVVLIRALPRILEREPQTVLVLVGRGPTLRQCLQESMELGVREHVVFPGCIADADLAALYEACDVFALPAGQDGAGNVEGFGLVYAEANAHGKPVIAGRSGGTIDAVIDGETGILVDAQSEQEVGDAIIRLMEDAELRMRLGATGRRRVETELNWRHFAEELLGQDWE